MAIHSNMLLATVLGASLALGQSFPVQSFETERFTAPSLLITRTNESTDPGYLFFTETLTGFAPLIMTDTSELIWRGPSMRAENFRTQTLFDEPVLSFWGGHKADHPVNSFGHGTGFVVIMDNTYKVAYNICISDDKLTWVTPDPSIFPGTVEHPCFLDRHESYITDRNTLVATAFNVTRIDLSPLGGPTDGWIFDALFFEIDIVTQEILFRWSAVENVNFTTSNYVNQDGGSDPLYFKGVHHGSAQSNAWDFFHINSVQPVSGGYLVNSRMTWSFYMVNGTTGKVEWTLEGSHGGDFTLEPGIFFSWQHMPRMHPINKTAFHISLFNNDNIRGLVAGTNHSTGYFLVVNTDTMHVTASKDLHDPAQPLFSVAEGSYQALDHNGHALLGYGAEPFIKEFNAKGKTIYTAQFNKKTGINSDGPHSYRSYRYGWHGFPTKKPRASASLVPAQTAAKESRVNIFMSWNGATDYDSWNVYAGDTPQTLKIVGQVARDGFESSLQLRHGTKGLMYVMAEAMLLGTGLANSTVVQIKST